MKRLPILGLVLVALAAVLMPLHASAANPHVRIVTSSAPLQLAASDRVVGLLRLTDPKPTAIKLPPAIAPGYTVTVEDLASNASRYPITVVLPPHGRLAGGASSVVLNADGKEATLRYFGAVGGIGVWGGDW